MADNALTKLPLAGQLGVSVALAALIFGGFYFFWWSDAMKEEATKKAKREALQKEIRALEVTANKLQEFQREVQLLEAKLETLKRILPPERETPDLMRPGAVAGLAVLPDRPEVPAHDARAEGLLPGGAHQRGAHRHLPQPRAVLRSRSGSRAW